MILKNNVYFLDGDFSVSYVDAALDEPQHTHQFVEFVYMKKGKSLHIVNGKEYSMSSGELLIINYNETHSFTIIGEGSYYNIYLKPNYINKAIDCQRNLFSVLEADAYKEFKTLINKDCRFVTFSPEEKKFFESMLVVLGGELESANIGYQAIVQSGANLILTMIFRKMNTFFFEKRPAIMQVLTYIEENYNQNISAAYLAELCHYNHIYFSRFFKKETGVTLTEYVKRIRIQKACELLELKNNKVNDVYVKVGYTNKTRFYTHFNEIMSMTPKEYKKLRLDTF